MDRETSRSKGFGFVEMDSGDQAQAAIYALNGQESNGRTLTVNEAKPREEREKQCATTCEPPSCGKLMPSS